MSERNVVLVLAKCSQARKLFGIRFDSTSANEWAASWSYPIKEGVAASESYTSAHISGAITIGVGFPGCPHCHSQSFFKCGCGKVGCCEENTKVITCPWCGVKCELAGQITDMDGGDER